MPFSLFLSLLFCFSVYFCLPVCLSLWFSNSTTLSLFPSTTLSLCCEAEFGLQRDATDEKEDGDPAGPVSAGAASGVGAALPPLPARVPLRMVAATPGRDPAGAGSGPGEGIRVFHSSVRLNWGKGT